jgi:homogentisate phytyltransferase/homogentisate geranylgeranyltransferase
MMKGLNILWRFSRPHTIIGSVISIYTLYIIVCDNRESIYFPYLFPALILGICCNVFIVGINQIADVEIDRINKPNLPIPSGVLNLKQAKIIVLSSLVISLLLAFFISFYLFIIILLATGIGWAYSMPPIYLKRYHIGAALSISFVRGILLNAAGFLVFNYLVNDVIEMPLNVKILTLFIVVFSIGISWFKDLTDIEGDKKFNIRTLAIVYSTKSALIAGNVLVSIAYIFTIYMKYQEYQNSIAITKQLNILFYGHILLLLLFISNAISINLNKHSSIQKFYKRFWWFFFAEYLLYLIAYSV